MKIEILEDPNLDEETVIIRYKKRTSEIDKLIKQISEASIQVLYRDQEKTIDLSQLLFFESQDETVYAHSESHEYKTRFKLYELENKLPPNFIRISKSCIVNLNHIESLERKLSSSRSIRFHHSHKIVYVSRMYYASLKTKLTERTLL